jgi:hypothetical protein
MSKLLVILAIALFGTMAQAQQSGQTGLGFMLGNPTGVTAKKWLSDTQAIDAVAGFSFGKHTNFSLHSDYLWHSKDALYYQDETPLDLYYGLGGSIQLGLRLPIGVSRTISESKADMFGEIAPIFDFVDAKRIEIHLAFGARYYF